jgi:hypothetical protein
MVGTLTGKRGIEAVASLDGAEEMDYRVQLFSGTGTAILTYSLSKSIAHCKYDAATSWTPFRKGGRA